jgi:hypothetical protein
MDEGMTCPGAGKRQRLFFILPTGNDQGDPAPDRDGRFAGR